MTFEILRHTGSLGQKTLKRILKFATGASRKPLLGFSMNPTIQFAEVMFSSASTCINQLILSIKIVDYDVFDMAFLNDFFGLE
ncbi:hypothetical protein CHS0354_029200 [Potamilus streckersoni]|uniref:HECT domain-containing protein n=1 Tax=Potamilus streckersoni TaxID=2493646 RepID=A0AAE0WCM6_9BIVA|nr:hypothetical protein CHS0354_029200 [Potamilus streckersoni]